MSFSETPDGRRAAQIQDNYAEALKRIRSDNNLTPEGKKEKIAAEYNSASAALGAIKDSENSAKTLRTHVLRRDLFGNTTTADALTAISFRDAQDRVGSLGQFDQEKALKLLDQAEISGDTVMVKALMQRAIELSWNEVANSHAENHPFYGDKLKELLSLQTPKGIFSNQDAWERGVSLNLQKPEELGWG
ncbi:hypothetical protein QF038_000991 [Pseudarthrobacter sp. W1I19]|uniref:hypothetical protein n=1 Tax=Pseudarthrobacter sp. W1I19 TaxID=3042288 RepID=UPI00278B7885|nr:hypothetical protein [Pseudarthrobacter sp. W1I19]MDQ0922483.1 hypothetical protein [Pseudarthrobacter sp. W1I19]